MALWPLERINALQTGPRWSAGDGRRYHGRQSRHPPCCPFPPRQGRPAHGPVLRTGSQVKRQTLGPRVGPTHQRRQAAFLETGRVAQNDEPKRLTDVREKACLPGFQPPTHDCVCQSPDSCERNADITPYLESSYDHLVLPARGSLALSGGFSP